MRRETVEAVVCWQDSLGYKEPFEITFHGGEPLVAGLGFYRMALPLLREGFAPRKVRFGMQSNLWLLTDELCELFHEYGVSLGTSLDGPEAINDTQRGAGYFKRTMAGIGRAQAHGLPVSCICTFTSRSAPHAEEIFDFFVQAGLSFSIHASLPSLQYPGAIDWTLSPEAYGKLLVKVLDRYLVNLDQVRVGTLDSLCKSIPAGQGGICVFGNCLGNYLSVAPRGEIYPCQRFAGIPAYQLGNVHECPTLEMLSTAPVWRMLQDRQARIAEECRDCPHLAICNGGCPYNVLAANKNFRHTLRDPYCSSYQHIFNHIIDRAMEEVFSEENLNAVINASDPEAGLLQRGKLLSIMKDGSHPYDTSQRARHTLAAVALAATGSPAEATRKFQHLGLVSDLERTEIGMQMLYQNSNTAFQKWGQQVGSSNQHCYQCTLRYLCVGLHNTWNQQHEQDTLDMTPMDCASLFQHARPLLAGALKQQGISVEQWEAVGLPLPNSAPTAKSILATL